MFGVANPDQEFFRLGGIVAFGIVIPGIVCIADMAYIDTGRCYALLLNFE